MSLSIHTIYSKIFKIWRQQRFSLFLRLMKPRHADILLDVGGLAKSWISHPQRVRHIVTVNVPPVHPTNVRTGDHVITGIVGDGCRLGFATSSYDIGFSNSVIEHVGSWERQQAFAAEIRRVAKNLWVQTPAYECPIEPHYLAPFIHYLPRSTQKALLRWCTLWGWITRPTPAQVEWMIETTRLLRKSEMHELFPDCEILTERLLWIIPKSYIAVRRLD